MHANQYTALSKLYCVDNVVKARLLYAMHTVLDGHSNPLLQIHIRCITYACHSPIPQCVACNITVGTCVNVANTDVAS